MNDTKTRAVSYRKTLFLLLLFTACLFFGQIGAMAQGLGTDDFWTTVGSAGTVDEKDLGIVELDTFSVSHKAGKTGTVHIRYNIVAIEGANQGDSKPFNGIHQIRVRYRDSDGHNKAANARVAFFIFRTNVISGLDQRIFTFDSNVNGEDVTTEQTATKTDCGTRFEFDFDFSRYFYWIDAQVTRNNTTDVASLSAIQITELTTTCSGPPAE